MQTRTNNFSYLILLTTTFFVWQLLYLSSRSNFHDSIISVFIFTKGGIKLPWPIFITIGINYFLLFFLHVLGTFAIWGIANLVGKFFKHLKQQVWHLGIIIWLMSVILVLVANQALYPSSVFASLLSPLISRDLAKVIMFTMGTTVLFFIGIAVMQSLFFIMRYRGLRVAAAGMVLAIPAGHFIYKFTNQTTSIRSIESQPNVIIVGIDDVIPEHIHYFGYTKTVTPNLDNFLAKSTVFTSSLTPLARTFVAWGSVLTGLYPVHSGIRENFQDVASIDFSDSLVANLHQAGYQTILATDDPSDASMISMDKYFGFDKIIAPPSKLANLLLAYLNDLPIANLLSNTRIGLIFFPSNYANRFAKITYNPDLFIDQIRNGLTKRSDKPLFLAIHLCLTHWPFVWAGNALSEYNNVITIYDASISRIDQQLQNLFMILEQEHILEHAIVVVLSDHGESFGSPQDRIISKQHYIKGTHSHDNLFTIINRNSPLGKDEILSSMGHGSDVLNYTQYHNLLAIRLFGTRNQATKNVSSAVSLIDLKPTILQLLKLPCKTTDGISLAPYILGDGDLSLDRMLFLETAFSPTSINTTTIDINKVIIEASNYYLIDPVSNAIKLKAEALPQIIKQRERAVYYRDWVLALLPSPSGNIPILVNRNTHNWTDDLTTLFAANSPALKMWQALKKIYGNDFNW